MGIWKFLWNILTGKASEGIPGNSDYDDQSDTAQYASGLTGITPPPKDEVPVTGDDKSILDLMKETGHGFSESSFGSFIKSLGQLIPALVNRISATHLTGAEQEANAFSAEQAQMDRNFQERMANTQYQRGVADMQAAGVNPALAYSQGGAAAPSGQAAASVQPQGQAFSMSDLMQMVLLPTQLKNMASTREFQASQGQAALENAAAARTNADANLISARANEKNALTREGELENEKRKTDILEREVSIKQLEYEVHKQLADSQVQVNNEMVRKIAQETSNLKKTYDQMDGYLEVARTSANAVARSAAAAWENAQAAVQDAMTRSYLSDYQAAVLAADEVLRYVQSEQGKVILDNLPESERLRLENLTKQGIVLDKQGNLIDKEGRRCTAQTIAEYVHMANECINTGISGVRMAATGGLFK